MRTSKHSRVCLSVEELETRAVPAALTAIEAPALAALVGEYVHVRGMSSAAASQARPFHLEETGAAVINPDGTINGNASGNATHLGRFSLHDTSTIVGAEITPDGHLVLQIVGQAELKGANGDKLCASITGSIDMTAGQGTLTFTWTGGTGRFTDASGTTVWQISVNPDLTYAAVADGVIKF